MPRLFGSPCCVLGRDFPPPITKGVNLYDSYCLVPQKLIEFRFGNFDLELFYSREKLGARISFKTEQQTDPYGEKKCCPIVSKTRNLLLLS